MAVWDEYQWHSSATSIQMPHADATINALDNQVQYWHISMPHFPRYMQLYETNHRAISNLWISNPCAGIEPAERETRTTTVDRACRVRRVGWTRSVRRRGTTVNALAFLKATYVRAKYDIWHAPAGESHATNAQRQERKHKVMLPAQLHWTCAQFESGSCAGHPETWMKLIMVDFHTYVLYF